MGNNLSKVAATECQSRVAIDGSKIVHFAAGCEGPNPGTGTQACHVEVQNWRSADRTFHLEDSVENPQDGFDDRLDWIDDTLHFTLQVPPSYPGGAIKLVQRVQQLLAGEPLLGIAARHVGRHAIRMVGEARGRPGKMHKWHKTSNLHGCICNYLRRAPTATTTEFKFVVQDDEAAIIVVDHNDEEYKEVVGDRPSTFLGIMALPVRVWLRTMQWCATYERVHKESNAQIDAIVDAARQAAARADSDAAVTATDQDKEDWWQNIVNIAVQSRQQAPSSPVPEDAAALDPARGQLNVERDERYGSDSPTEPSFFVGQEGSQVTASQPTLTPAEEGSPPNTPSATATIDEQSGAGEDGREQSGTQGVQVDMDEGVEFGPAKDEKGPQKDRETTEAETSTLPTLPPPPPSPSSSSSGTMGKQPSRKERRRIYNKEHKKEKRRAQRIAERASLDTVSEDHESGSDTVNKDVAGDDVVDDGLAASTTPPAESASPPSVLTTPNTLREASLSPRLSITSSAQTPNSPSAPSQPTASHPVRVPIPLPRMHVNKGKGEAVDLRASTPEVQSTTGKGNEPEPHDRQPQRQAVDEVTPSRQEEISTRSDRISPGPSSEPGPSSLSESSLSGSTKPSDSTKPTTVASKQQESQGTEKKSRKSKSKGKGKKKNKGKGKAQLPETGSELDNPQQAPSPMEETRQHDVQAQVAAVTDTSSLHSHTSTEVASTSSTTPDVTESAVDSNRLRVLSITVPTAALAALDFNHPSDASAEDSSSDAGSETPRPTPRLGVSSTEWSSEEAQSTPSSPVTASQEWRSEPSPGATLTRPHSTGNTVDSAVGRTREGASLRADPAAMPGPSTVVSPGSGAAADASAATLSGSAATPAVTPSHGAQSSRQHAAMPAASAGAEQEHQSSSATPPSTTGSGTSETPTPTATSGNGRQYQRVEKQKGGFWWDLTYHTFRCALPSCTKRCHLWDGSSVICPRCGPYSQIRYCEKAHQREDVKWHWTYCGSPEYTFMHWCVPSSVPPDVAVGPPLLPCIWGWDMPERFRQALWFSTGRREGDYFIFADWQDQVRQGHVPGSVDGRCSPRVVRAVQFADPEEKDRFRRCLAVCLLSSPEHPLLADYLFRMIRDKLRSQNQWGAEMDVALRHQIQFEMGITLRPSVTGQRHACSTEWTGQSQRHCQSQTCAHEVAIRRRQQPNVPLGGSFEALCHEMECTYWLLRAHRTTHPTTSDVAARTRGEGYGDDVAPRDRREFRRGEGWDGAGSGPLEIDGPFLPSLSPAPG